MAASTLTILPESMAVDDAATKALNLVNEFANEEIFSSINPDEVFAELDRARNNVIGAWNTLELAIQNQNQNDIGNSDDGNTHKAGAVVTDFRPAFMDMITDAFADVLDDLRRSSPDGEIDVNVLVDCLQSGMDLFVATANDETDFSWNKLEEEEEEEEEQEQEQVQYDIEKEKNESSYDQDMLGQEDADVASEEEDDDHNLP